MLIVICILWIVWFLKATHQISVFYLIIFWTGDRNQKEKIVIGNRNKKTEVLTVSTFCDPSIVEERALHFLIIIVQWKVLPYKHIVNLLRHHRKEIKSFQFICFCWISVYYKTGISGLVLESGFGQNLPQILCVYSIKTTLDKWKSSIIYHDLK